MDDRLQLLPRLRALGNAEHDDLDVAHEAADEIERLRAELSTLSAATASVQTDQRAAIDQSRELLRIVTAERDSLRSKIADDSFATTFQTMGQYRTALLRALLPPNVQVSGARAEGNEASGCRDASAPT